MKKYFTIGEISKMKGVGIKSLRYYDKVGVLKPAYINQETGYRYYTAEQLFFLDNILLSIELGIPLKEFLNFIDEEGNIRLQSFLSYARNLMQEKRKRLETGITKTEYILNDISRHKKDKKRTVPYVRFLPERNIIKIPFGEGDYSTEYAEKITQLVFLAEENRLHTTYLAGLIHYLSPSETKRFIYIEVLENAAELPEFTKIPAGNYRCICSKNILFDDDSPLLSLKLEKKKEYIIIEADVFESTVKYNSYTVELQILQP